MSTSADVFDLAIIGGGPAGVLLANLMGQAGLNVCVLEQDAQIYPLPRAIHFDGEVMRIFQAAGLRAAVEAISRPGLKGMRFVNADGQTLMIRAGTAALGPHGCANNYYFHQPQLEQVLRDGLNRFASVQLRLQHQVIDIDDQQDSVHLQVNDRVNNRAYALRARYVVGCDGARSLTRKQLQSGAHDLGLHQPWLVFDVILNDNAPELPDQTVQYCDPARPMTYCNVTGRRRRWEIMLMPGDDPVALQQEPMLWRLVSRWLRSDQARIERAAIYTFHSIVNDGWRRGRLLIAGDAAHQTPPFLGQGMCAALRDVHNLSWKLIMVLQGRANGALLNTYESERAPHVRAFIELAVRLGDVIQATDPQLARQRDERFLAGSGPEIFQFPSPRLGPGVLHGDSEWVGQPFPQPQLDDGSLLDQRLGAQFAVIATADILAGIAATTRLAWRRAQLVELTAVDSALVAWLETNKLQAVVLRPDRYVMAVASNALELDQITASLP